MSPQSNERLSRDSVLGRILEVASIPLFAFGLIILGPFLDGELRCDFTQAGRFFAVSIPMFLVGWWLRCRAARSSVAEGESIQSDTTESAKAGYNTPLGGDGGAS